MNKLILKSMIAVSSLATVGVKTIVVAAEIYIKVSGVKS